MQTPIRLIEYWEGTDITTARDISDVRHSVIDVYMTAYSKLRDANEGQGDTLAFAIVPEYFGEDGEDTCWHVQELTGDEQLEDLLQTAIEYEPDAVLSHDIRIAYFTKNSFDGRLPFRNEGDSTEDSFSSAQIEQLPDEFVEPDLYSSDVFWE